MHYTWKWVNTITLIVSIWPNSISSPHIKINATWNNQTGCKTLYWFSKYKPKWFRKASINNWFKCCSTESGQNRCTGIRVTQQVDLQFGWANKESNEEHTPWFIFALLISYTRWCNRPSTFLPECQSKNQMESLEITIGNDKWRSDETV